MTAPINDYEIKSDGRVVWVNRATLLGRFSRMGIDVHVDGRCVGDSCTVGHMGRADWDQFKVLMMEIHYIEVPDRFMPDYLKEKR